MGASHSPVAPGINCACRLTRKCLAHTRNHLAATHLCCRIDGSRYLPSIRSLLAPPEGSRCPAVCSQRYAPLLVFSSQFPTRKRKTSSLKAPEEILLRNRSVPCCRPTVSCAMG